MGWSKDGWSAEGGWYKPASVASFTTWDPANKGPNVVLSNGNLSVTVTSGYAGAFQNVKALASASSGKKYFEWKSDLQQTFGLPGICNGSQSMDGEFLGGTANSVGFVADGRVYVANVNVSTIQTYAQGDTVCVALDIGNQMIWFRTNGGNWNNSGTADPATNVGGIDISAVSGPYFPGGQINNDADAFTANFGATAYAQAIPSGFGNW